MGPWRAVRHALLGENVILINIFSPVYINVQTQELNNWYLSSFLSVSCKNVQHGIENFCWNWK